MDTNKIQILITLIILSLSVYLHPVSGQSFAINYTAKDGIENDNVLAITEDQNGYIYIGTASGVMLFDGVDFVPFYKEGTGTIPENVFVYDLTFDKLDNLWVRTELDGIFHWDRIHNHWTNFSTSAEPVRHLPNNEVKSIFVIDSFLYFSCLRHGLSSIDIHTLEVRHKIDNSTNSYTDIDEAENRLILNGHRNLLLLKNNQLQTLARSDKSSFDNTYIYNDQIYIAKYESGLYTIDNEKLKSLGIEDHTDPRRTKIIGVSNHKELIMTCQNSGLVKFDPQSNTFTVINSEPYNFNSLIKAKYNGGFIDKKGRIWIATSKGISCFHPDLQGFQSIQNKDQHSDFLIDAIYHKTTKSYIGVYSSTKDKVKIFDENFNITSSYNHTPKTPGIRSIYKIMEHKNQVYAASHRLYRVNPMTGECTPLDEDTLGEFGNVTCANIDQNGLLWFTNGNGTLVVYNLLQKKIEFQEKIPLLTKSKNRQYNISTINFDDQSAYISAGSALFHVSKSKYEINSYAVEGRICQAIETNPPSDNKITIVLPHKEYVYISSRNDGLLKTKFDTGSQTFQTVAHLTSSELYSPLDLGFDTNDNLWVATDNGLALLDVDLQLIKRYDRRNGLQNTKLSTGLSIANDIVLLNDERGIIVGDPSNLTYTTKPIAVDITSFKVNGKQFSINTTRPTFSYSNNNIQIHTSIPNYGTNSDYAYEYRLLGNNQAWQFAPIENNKISYENLNPNQYTFETRCTSSNTKGPVSSFDFEITPPFWKTKLFLILTLLVSGAFLTILYKYRVNQKLEKEKVNTLLSKLENTAIRSQLNPHFIFNSLNSIRSMILLDRKADSVQYLEQFSDMVREVLQMSKEEKVTLEHEIAFNRNYLEIEKLRFSNKFKYTFNVSEHLDSNNVIVPPLILQPFIENAIWHGLLHNDKESILTIDINTRSNQLHITIDDNGIGREKSRQIQKSSLNKTKKNLGVSLSKKRISMLGKDAQSTINDKYENGIAAGTTVTIQIPLTHQNNTLTVQNL